MTDGVNNTPLEALLVRSCLTSLHIVKNTRGCSASLCCACYTRMQGVELLQLFGIVLALSA